LNVVILGAGNVGLATAARLAPEHALVLVDRRAGQGLRKLREAHPEVAFVQADASVPSQLEAAFAGAFGGAPIDALVCTVGTRSPAGAVDDFAGFRRDFDTNVFGNLVPIRAAVPRMSPAGRITVVSSTSGHHAPSDLSAYAPSKWALEVLCGALGSELATRGIEVRVVAPTTLRNRHSDVFTTPRGLPPERVALVIARGLAGRGRRHAFVPRSRRAIHLLERLAPGWLDWAAGLRPLRRRGFARSAIATGLITGASSGLGRELARIYARELQELWLVARNGPALAALQAELARDGGCRVHVRVTDLADPDAVEALAALADQRASFAVNFLAPVRLTGRLLAGPHPPRKLVTVLSTTAVAGRRGLGAYGASKAALWSFTRSLRRASERPLQVLEVMPATFRSDLVEKGRRTTDVRGEGVPQQHAPAARQLSARAVAERIREAERGGRERLLVPFEAHAFLWLEAIAPRLFRRWFA
jgi:NAD(P)-dependent dehydrogenase (short-subunit alcohol dehydrogenase family)